MIDDESIKGFMAAYEKDFGKPIEFCEARVMATNFFTLLLHVSRVPPSKRVTQSQ